MIKLFTENAWNDYLYWQETDKQIVKRINKLIMSIERDGFSVGIGKPEPLKHDLRSYWSRRTNDEHRIIYKIDDNKLVITSCKDHY